MLLTAADLDTAAAAVATALQPTTALDWTARASGLDWDCWHTAEHIGDCLLSYAGQVVAQPTDRYVRFVATADAASSPAEVLEFALAAGRILAATVSVASPDARAFHPTGQADPVGFAGMGCLELLLHGDDIARGLGTAVDPSRELCTRLLARMFPEQSGLDGVDPWLAVRWCSGRADLPDRPHRTKWAWRGAPL
jgi:hypothetical protein